MPEYFLGLDLGQAADFTALAILERSFEDRAGEGKRLKHFACRGLKRWPLGTAYTAIVEEMRTLTAKAPLKDSRLVIDATGVGRPVVEMFKEAKLSVTLMPVLITAGHKESYANGFHNVAKVQLVSTLQVLLQQRRLQFPKGLAETQILMRELQNYRSKITPALHETFNAREGEHDDLVLACALAGWSGERIPEVVSIKAVRVRPGVMG